MTGADFLGEISTSPGVTIRFTANAILKSFRPWCGSSSMPKPHYDALVAQEVFLSPGKQAGEGLRIDKIEKSAPPETVGIVALRRGCAKDE